MSDSEQNVTDDVTIIEGHAIIEIPVEHTGAVLEFIAGIERESADVSAYMLSGGLWGGISTGGLNIKITTESGCVQTRGKDWNCCDTDQE